jgi:hypothetical protein
MLVGPINLLKINEIELKKQGKEQSKKKIKKFPELKSVPVVQAMMKFG